MMIRRIEVGPFQSNCYLLPGGEEQRGLVIDPGDDAARLLSAMRSLPFTPAAVLLTHGHVDHLSGLAGILEFFPVPAYLHPADQAWAFRSANQLPPYYDAPRGTPPDMRSVNDGDCLDIAGISVTVLATPGHTPGGVCYRVADTGDLFTGDTLFHGSVGRTDFPGGDVRAMTASLRRLAALPPETRVWPGHGPDTTLAEELRSNPFLAPLRRPGL